MNILEFAKMRKIAGGGGKPAVIEPLSVTENGTYTPPEGVDGYAPVTANIVNPPDSATVKDLIDAKGNCNYLFYCSNVDYDTLSKVLSYSDTANVQSLLCMFFDCKHLTALPLLDTSNVTTMEKFFACNTYCSTKVTSIPLYNTSKVTNMSYIFHYRTGIDTIPEFDTRNVTNITYAFSNGNFKVIPRLDFRSVTGANYTFNYLKEITEIWVRNIKTALQVGSGTLYGHLLTVESLIHLIYELRDTGSVKKLTVGTANMEKLASVYVKTIEVTDEMRAEDDLVDEKLPFIVCESTDEGATLITEYVLAKNWELA